MELAERKKVLVYLVDKLTVARKKWAESDDPAVTPEHDLFKGVKVPLADGQHQFLIAGRLHAVAP